MFQWLRRRQECGPRYSVIIPTFRAAEKLEHTLASLAHEPAGLFEIVVVDGGSEDSTRDLVERHGRIRWISERDDGVYDAMNKGVRLARGDYLLFLGAGDRLRPGVLEKVQPSLPRNSLGFVYGNAFMHDKGVVWDGPWDAAKFRTRNICHQAIFYGRAVFDRLGGFDTTFHVLADYAFNIRCFGDRKIAKIFVDEVITDYEGHGFSTGNRDEAFYAARPALLKQHLGVEEKKKPSSGAKKNAAKK